LPGAITAASAAVGVFHRELVPGQMCSYRGVLKSPQGPVLLTADVVALWVARGDNYAGTLEDLNVSGVYAQTGIIRPRAARVHLIGAATCDPEVVETRTVENRVVCSVSFQRS